MTQQILACSGLGCTIENHYPVELPIVHYYAHPCAWGVGWVFYRPEPGYGPYQLGAQTEAEAIAEAGEIQRRLTADRE